MFMQKANTRQTLDHDGLDKLKVHLLLGTIEELDHILTTKKMSPKNN
jgi:hypothetical protein